MIRQTVSEIIKSCHRYGTFKKPKRAGTKPWPMPEEVERYLLEGLYEHRYLSIKARCDLVWRKFRFALKEDRLKKFY